MDRKQNFLYTGNGMNAEERNAFAAATPCANSEDIFQAENGMFKDNLGEYRDKNGIKYMPDGIPALTFPNTKGWEQPTHWAHPKGSGLTPEDYPELKSSFYEDPETKLRVRKPAAWELPGAVNVAQVGGGAGVGTGAGNGTPGAVGPSPLPGRNETGGAVPQQPGKDNNERTDLRPMGLDDLPYFDFLKEPAPPRTYIDPSRYSSETEVSDVPQWIKNFFEAITNMLKTNNPEGFNLPMVPGNPRDGTRG